uniref:Serpin domain-containing protein n=1 Tax=Strigamia maritima TaxID=126957 RepID=T1IIG5_STRMM
MDEDTAVLVDRLIRCNNKFALQLFKRICTHCSNILVSPLSVSSVLAMLLVGARGQTETQLKQILHLQEFSLTEDEDENANDDNANGNSQIHLAYRHLLNSITETGNTGLNAANRLYIQEDVAFDGSVSDYLAENYGADVGCADFARAGDEARAQINDWVSEKIGTDSWQQGLVGEGVVDLFTTLVAITATTFLGEWQFPFNEGATCLYPFNAGGGRKIVIDLMHTPSCCEFRTAFNDDLNCQLVELPYKEDRFAMLLIIPSEHEDLHVFEDKIDVDILDALVGQLEPSSIKIALPRFRVACTFSLSDIIGDMGAGLVLNPDSADLTGFTASNEEGVCLSALIHGTELRVIEKGTEYSPSTPQDSDESEDEGNEIVVDRPFIFILRDTKSGLILFTGCIHEPSTEEM